VGRVPEEKEKMRAGKKLSCLEKELVLPNMKEKTLGNKTIVIH